MFHKTFDTASDQDERAVPPGLQLALSSENQDCSSSMLASPDSNSSISIMSDAEASSSPDVLDSCILDCSQANNLHNTKTRHDGLCNATMNVNETFTATAVNDTINFWNETFILMSQDDMGSQEYITFSQCPKGETFHAGAPPCSATKDCLISTCETPCRGSTENDCLSVSSGEMIVRSNSFGLDDQAQVLVSSLDESICAAGDVGALPADSNLLSVTLPDIWENPPKGNVESKGNPCLDLTFTQEVNCDCPTEDNDVALSDSMVALPAENEGLLTTFVCETTASCQKEETRAEAEPLPSTFGAVARDPQPAVQEREESICTSTPIQPAVNRRPNLPSFSASPFCDGTGGAGVPVKRNASKRSAAAGQSPLANKKTMEIKKFPKSDFSHVKPKIVTRVPVAATGPTSQRKAPQAEVSKMKKFAIVLSTKPKAFDFAQRRRNASASNLGTPLKESSAPNKQGERTGPQSDNQPVANDLASAGQSSNAASEGEPTESQQAGSDTACLAALEQSPDRCGQLDLQPAPKKVISSKNEVRSGSAFGQNKPAAIKTLLRRSSESSLGSQPPKEKRTLLKFSKSFTTPRARTHQDQTKAGNLKSFSQRELAAQASAASSPREDNTIPLVEGSDKLIPSGASGDDAKRGSRGKTPSRPARGTPLPKGPAPSPKPTTARLQLGTLGKIGCRTPKAGATLPLKPKIDAGSHKVPSSLGTHSAAGSKPQPNDSRPAQTPSRPLVKGPALTPSWRPPLRTPGSSHGPAKAKAQADGASTSQVSHGAGPKPTPLKSVFKAKLFSTPAKTLKPALATTCKAATPSLLTRSASARLVRPTFGGSVDKNKSRAGPRQQPPQPPATKPSQGSRPPDVDPPASVAEDERKGHIIQQLRGLLAASNCRFEAVAVVLQQSLAERDEATKQCRELSQELVSLQGELVCSVNSSERLEKEKEGLRVTLEETLHRVQEQHQKDLAELEQRLQAFYQAEWNKMHLAYQEEADKCNAALQQQMGELEAKHEAMKLDLENRHVEQLQSVKQQYENSLDELKQVHNEELQSLEKTLRDAEASLSGRIQELMEENGALMEKLTAEETRRKELAQKSQKDSHTLYLEQELESLKVVLDMKTTQLHQQEKKLMEVDKLTEKNMKLDEILKKVQQENEDLKARMERHAALSRQLSTEQAVLQESLQKESKVNKRLSMENEELLWKLNNNDLSSPRKVSPSSSSSSPSHAFSLQSPRSSGLLSSPPVSPR